MKPFRGSVILIVIAILVLIGIGVFFGLKKLDISIKPKVPTTSTQTSPTATPSNQPLTATPTANPTANWEVYSDSTYKFEIKYPTTYKITDDKYGWPKSIFMLYKGGQSYDLVIEVWDNEADYKAKYKNQMDTVTVKQSGGKFLTLLNMNKDPEVDQIISTFKFLK